MRVAVDVRYSTASGAASYINNLLPLMLKRAERPDFLIIDYPERADRWRQYSVEVLPIARRSAWRQALSDQFLLPRELRRRGVDVFHPMKLLGTLHPSVRQLTTAHSITAPYKGEFPISRAEELYWIHFGKWLFKRSERLIAVSGFVKNFLMDVMDIPPERIDVIPHGVNPIFLQGEAAERTDSPYLLIVGNVFPVKNQITAVRILASIAQQYPKLRLVLAGGTKHPYCTQVREFAAKAGLASRVEFLGFVPPEKLVQLYQEATLLLMPSLTEGCPVTLLEALGCGAAIIGSRRGGIPEVGGSAIVCVDDPYDVQAWVTQVRRLLDDEQARQLLRHAAVQRAREFSWEKAADETLKVYDAMQQE